MIHRKNVPHVFTTDWETCEYNDFFLSVAGEVSVTAIHDRLGQICVAKSIPCDLVDSVEHERKLCLLLQKKA